MKVKRTKSAAIYDDLATKIAGGELKPGDVLPPEARLAKQYGVAVLTLRQALAKLREEGRIESRPYHGTRVISPSQPVSTMEKTLGLFAPAGEHAITHPVFSRLINGFEGALTEAGFQMELVFTDPACAESESALLAKLEYSRAVGWLAPIQLSEDVRSFLVSRHLPVVLMHFPNEELTGHVFEVDYTRVADKLLRKLTEAGCRSVTVLTPPTMVAWCHALMATSLQNPDMPVLDLFEIDSYCSDAGSRGVRQVLAHRKCPDAFVCADDAIAIGAIHALREAGRSVPQDVMVVGGGDFPVGALFSPSLTTVSYPYYQTGREAGRLLVDLALGKQVTPMHRKLFPNLILRDSTRNDAESILTNSEETTFAS